MQRVYYEHYFFYMKGSVEFFVIAFIAFIIVLWGYAAAATR